MSITNNNVTSATSDLVAILDANGQQVFPGARPVKATSSPEIMYTTHPREDGGNITDSRIVLPQIVSLSVILNPATYRDTIQAIHQAAIDSTEFIVQTKSRTYQNMYLTAYPTEENVQFFDTIKAELTFKEVKTESAITQTLPADAVADPADSSTVSRGQQSSSEAQDGDQTLAQRIFS